MPSGWIQHEGMNTKGETRCPPSLFPSFHLSICPSIHPSSHLPSVLPSFHPSICPSILHLPFCLSMHPSIICPSIHPSAIPFIRLSTHPAYIYLSIRASVLPLFSSLYSSIHTSSFFPSIQCFSRMHHIPGTIISTWPARLLASGLLGDPEMHTHLTVLPGGAMPVFRDRGLVNKRFVYFFPICAPSS